MYRLSPAASLLLLGLAALAAPASAQLTVGLTPSATQPVPVGTPITFTATASDDNAGPDAPPPNLWYRFRVRRQGGQFQIVRDFGPDSSLRWTASGKEGVYEVEASIRNLDAASEYSTTSLVQFQSLVQEGKAVVTPTSNSLVFLYSAPPCAAGSRMAVQFQTEGSPAQRTPFQACGRGLTMNFYLAGMLANTAYSAHHIVDSGFAFKEGPDISFTTGDLPPDLYKTSIVVPSHGSDKTPGLLLGGPLAQSPVAHDLNGNVVWYGPPGITFFTRVEAGGEFWGVVEAAGDLSLQIVRKFDLVGDTLLETNAARVNEQLLAMGKRAISGFHHEARPLAGGRVAILAGVEQLLTGVQGPGTVDVLGDMIIVLDQNLNVVWTWDTFDHLDPSRAATLGEICPNAGCPTFYLAPNANDWTHGNALQLTSDGNFLYSARNQDWLIKIGYDGGNGDGHIIWKLGRDGDFQTTSNAPYPWFSHQHDGNFEIADPTRLLVFDNGNTRVAAMAGGNSRGQVWQIDEANRLATPLLNADLGLYSSAVGSARRLRNGNYHFDAGFVQQGENLESFSFELDANGLVQYEAHQNVVLYRTFRLSDMYTPN